mmetsp:Transcript_23343/g.36023  ORF Transcript_23343/g.36023 Transcript_23343/m.36023 type:complete len:86 (+) Transcript_23343:491-748(+)
MHLIEFLTERLLVDSIMRGVSAHVVNLVLRKNQFVCLGVYLSEEPLLDRLEMQGLGLDWRRLLPVLPLEGECPSSFKVWLEPFSN